MGFVVEPAVVVVVFTALVLPVLVPIGFDEIELVTVVFNVVDATTSVVDVVVVFVGDVGFNEVELVTDVVVLIDVVEVGAGVVGFDEVELVTVLFDVVDVTVVGAGVVGDEPIRTVDRALSTGFTREMGTFLSKSNNLQNSWNYKPMCPLKVYRVVKGDWLQFAPMKLRDSRTSSN